MNLKKLAVVVSVAGATFASSYALAATYTRDTFYFSDSARTNVVGERYTDCQGEVSMWGTVTIYSRTYREACGGIPP